MQDVLEAFTLGSVQHGLDCLRTIRLPCQALHALLVKGLDNITDSLDRTAYQLRNGLWGQP
jgi:hypothetical protein